VSIGGTHSVPELDGSRTVEIGVVEGDEQPYLGVETYTPELSNGSHTDVPRRTVQHNLGYQAPLGARATVTAESTLASLTV